MSDNTKTYKIDGSDDDLISTDELVLLNGQPSTGVKVQRTKVGFGVDGELQDVSTTDPLPVHDDALAALVTAQTAAIGSMSAASAATPVDPEKVEPDTQNALMGDPATHNGDESFTMVALHPDYPLVLDPGQVLPVGGSTPSGSALPLRADMLGGQILSDAPSQLQGTAFNGGANSILLSCDTQGYQSISVQIKGTWVGTVSFYCSNDNSQWDSVVGWSSGAAGAPVSAATVNGTWIFPCIGRYFKAQITVYTSGAAVGVAYLRNQPLPFIPTTPAVNVSQLAGNTIQTAGANGVAAIGGYHTVGSTASVAGVLVNAVDAAGKVRRVQTDDQGALVVTGKVNNVNPVKVVSSQSNTGEDGMGDALNQIVRELRYTNFLLQQFPLYLNNGLSQMDEGDRFRGDPTLPN